MSMTVTWDSLVRGESDESDMKTVSKLVFEVFIMIERAYPVL